MHEHIWEPIPKWYGRYRCSECGAIGYRGLVTVDFEDPIGPAWQAKKKYRYKIIGYKCSKCDCLAIQKSPKLCAKCLSETRNNKR